MRRIAFLVISLTLVALLGYQFQGMILRKTLEPPDFRTESGTLTMRPGVEERFYVLGTVRLINNNDHTCLRISPQGVFRIESRNDFRVTDITPFSGKKELALVKVVPASECGGVPRINGGVWNISPGIPAIADIGGRVRIPIPIRHCLDVSPKGVFNITWDEGIANAYIEPKSGQVERATVTALPAKDCE